MLINVFAPWLLAGTLGTEMRMAPVAGSEPERVGIPEGAKRRLGAWRFRCGSPEWSVAIAPDGRYLAIVEEDGALRLVEAATGLERRLLEADGQDMRDRAVFSPDSAYLAALDDENGVHIWEVATGRRIHHVASLPFQPRSAGLPALALSAGGSALALGTWPQDVRVMAWTFKRGGPPRLFEVEKRGEGGHVILSSDGKVLAAWAVNITVWEVATGRQLRFFKSADGAVGGAAFSPDGKSVAIAGHGGTGTMQIFDLASGKERYRFSGGPHQVSYMAFSPDGGKLAAGNNDRVSVWDLPMNRRVGGMMGPPCSFQGFAFANGRPVACGLLGRSIRLWDVLSGIELTPPGDAHGYITSIGFGRGGTELVAASATGELFWWEVATGRQVQRLDLALADSDYSYRPTEEARCVVSPDGAHALIQPKSGPIRILDAYSGRVLFPAPSGVSFGISSACSRDGRTAAIPGMMGNETTVVFVRDLRTGKLLSAPETRRDLYGVAVSDTGDLVAARVEAGQNVKAVAPTTELIVWRTATGRRVQGFLMAGMPNFGWSVQPSLAFSPDGRLIAGTEAQDKLGLWDTLTGRPWWVVGRAEKDHYPMVFSPDGRTIAVGVSDPNGREGEVDLREVASGAVRAQFRGHRGAVTALAFAPDGKTLASGSSDTTVLLWGLLPSALSSHPQSTDADRLWHDLDSMDGSVAYRALWGLTDNPERGVGILKARLAPASSPPTADVLALLIGQLDAPESRRRGSASRRLAQAGKAAIPPLRAMLKRERSAESRRRAEDLLAELERDRPGRGDFRVIRAVEALEHIGTASARRLLEDYSKGAPDAWLTREAKASLSRLARREQR